MKKIILSITVALAILAPLPAEAAGRVHCKILSTTIQTQSRNITGVIIGVKYVNGKPVYVYGSGIQSREKVTVTQRCRGKISTTVTYTVWR